MDRWIVGEINEDRYMLLYWPVRVLGVCRVLRHEFSRLATEEKVDKG